MAFLPKTLCDVTKVEIAVGIRLTANSVEGFTFRVPRTRDSYFQDDIYPDTLCLEEPALTVEEWLRGKNALQRILNLKPLNMKTCRFNKSIVMLCQFFFIFNKVSEAPKEAPAAKKYASINPQFKTDLQKKEEVANY